MVQESRKGDLTSTSKKSFADAAPNLNDEAQLARSRGWGLGFLQTQRVEEYFPQFFDHEGFESVRRDLTRACSVLQLYLSVDLALTAELLDSSLFLQWNTDIPLQGTSFASP